MHPCPITLAHLAVLLNLLIPGCGDAGGRERSQDAALGQATADSLIRQITKERNETGEWLKKSPTSYLATIQRADFGDRRTLTVGRASGNDVRIDDPGIAAHHLRVTVDGDSFRVEAVESGAQFSVGGKPATRAVLPPSAFGLGRFTLRLSHQGFPAIILFDPSSPRFGEYKGLKYFPVDLSYRYVLPLKPNPKQDTVTIVSTRGNRRRGIRVGWFEFPVNGVPCRLAGTRLLEPGVGEKSYSIFFRDQTCGKESYPMGRYVEV